MTHFISRHTRSRQSIVSSVAVVTLLGLSAIGVPPRLMAQTVTPASATADAAPAEGQPASTGRSYVGASQRFTRVAGQTTKLLGVDGAWVSPSGFSAGLAAFARVGNDLTNPRADVASQGDALDFGYGGVTLGYTQPVGSGIQVYARALLGGGGINYRAARHDDVRNGVQNTFAVAEPSVGVEMAVGGVARVGVEGGYRFASRVAFDGLRNGDIRGPSGGVTIRVGGF